MLDLNVGFKTIYMRLTLNPNATIEVYFRMMINYKNSIIGFSQKQKHTCKDGVARSLRLTPAYKTNELNVD